MAAKHRSQAENQPKVGQKPHFRLIFGRDDRTRTCGILLPKQARYQLRHISLFFFRSALLALLRFPKHLSAYRLDVSTAAIRSAPLLRHRRRSPRSPKAYFRQLYMHILHLAKLCFAAFLPCYRQIFIMQALPLYYIKENTHCQYKTLFACTLSE